jgi:large subunit ribosomal protein L35Ae
MKGIVVQFRRGRHNIHERHFLLDLGLDSRDAAKKMAGKEVKWKSVSGKIISGKISDAHGNRGLVRAIFERGLPGQAITEEVEVVGGVDKKELSKKSKNKESDGNRKKELSNVRGDDSEVEKKEKVDDKESEAGKDEVGKVNGAKDVEKKREKEQKKGEKKEKGVNKDGDAMGGN